MRLWHYKIIKYLPKSQLLSQWRELNSIYVNQPNHILINYVYAYPKWYLECYSNIILKEMIKRGFNISNKSKENYKKYFEKDLDIENFWNANKNKTFSIYPEHNDVYLTICYYNLLEKFRCGQKDFSIEEFSRLRDFYYKEMNISE